MKPIRQWAAIGFCCFAAVACQPKDAAKEPATAVNESFVELAESDVAMVRAGEIGQVLRANGTLRAVQQSSVRAKVAGEIAEVTVREGERVTAGQVLARIDRSEYISRLGDRQASFEAARAQSAFAESTRRKNEDLVNKKFISPQAYDNAKSGAEIGAAQAQSLEAQVALAQKALDDTVVRAPIAGWVAERAVQRGDKTAVDGKLFTIVDLGRLELEALVPANEIARVDVGQAFALSVEGYGERRFEGRVARIGPQAAAGSRSVPIYIEIANPDAALKAGLFAEGTLSLGRHAATALAPIPALRSESGVSFVYAIDSERIRRQPVEIGLVSETEGTAEIVKGLAAGNRIVAANLGVLKEGARVRAAAKR
ncbi:MAG: efflux RND transporter periplasmic adaptor subunit [Proteobacteria bacterium]|nr:efflux RND transporter periplasmic adaptor subunit [Pseudomonadota bacterium]